MPRLLNKGWVDEYLSVIDRYSEAPKVWNWWSAATALQASLKRRVYVNRGSWKLYPNDFTVLVGRPGLGKGSAINPVHDILKRASTSNILSDKLTIEWILEALSKGFPTTSTTTSGAINFGIDTSCIFVAPELSVFLRYPETELPDLADLWDARKGIQMYGTRGKGLVKIENPTPTMLGGCAPEWLVNAVPSNAIGGGFTRRVNFVYAGQKSQDKIWPDTTDWDPLTEPLVQDLRIIGSLNGEYKFDSDAKLIFETLYRDSNPDDHDDQATSNYVISRWAHVTKLAMALAASKRDDLVLLKDDMDEAYEAVKAVTEGLRIVFRSVGESDMATVADKLLQFLERKPGATYKQILGALWKDVTAADLQIVLMTLRDGDILEEKVLGGNTIYTVLPQHLQVKAKVKVKIKTTTP